MIDLYEEFKLVVTALAEKGIDYALCGGLAMAVYGFPPLSHCRGCEMKVDLSVKAVTTRLKRVSQLRRLCLALGNAQVSRAKWVEPTGQQETEYRAETHQKQPPIAAAVKRKEKTSWKASD